jgi:electron transfer flavoprotein alpha subunit
LIGDYMTIVVIAEHAKGKLNAATASTVTAARKLGGPIYILLAGADCHDVAQQAAQLSGVTAVKYADASYYADQLPENISALILENLIGVTHVLAPSTSFGKRLMPRVAALLDVSQISDIVEVESADQFVRPVYSGNIFETVRSNDPVKVITVRPSAFEAVREGNEARIDPITPAAAKAFAKIISRQSLSADQPDLATATIVVSGGRGLGSQEQFQTLLVPLANTLGAAVGASRAAVDAGFTSNALQVGETGKIVAPKLYFAIGISGAIQHVAGIMESQIIVAINNDPDAAIFNVADYGLVGDLFELVPQLVQQLSVEVPA